MVCRGIGAGRGNYVIGGNTMQLGGIVTERSGNLKLFERMEAMLKKLPKGTRVRIPVFVSDKEHGAPYFAVEKVLHVKDDLGSVMAYLTAIEEFAGDIIGKDVEIKAGIELHKIV